MSVRHSEKEKSVRYLYHISIIHGDIGAPEGDFASAAPLPIGNATEFGFGLFGATENF